MNATDRLLEDLTKALHSAQFTISSLEQANENASDFESLHINGLRQQVVEVAGAIEELIKANG